MVMRTIRGKTRNSNSMRIIGKKQIYRWFFFLLIVSLGVFETRKKHGKRSIRSIETRCDLLNIKIVLVEFSDEYIKKKTRTRVMVVKPIHRPVEKNVK